MAITKSLNEYQINATGKLKGINIPTGHRLLVPQAIIRRNGADDGYVLQVEVSTYKDSNHTGLLINDLLPDDNLPFDLGATLPTKSIQAVVKTELETWLDDNVGVGKWAEIK